MSSIEATSEELQERIGHIRMGDSPERVRRSLGGEPFKTEDRDNKRICFWRFKILDESLPRKQYELYMGEFEEDRLVFASLLPTG